MPSAIEVNNLSYHYGARQALVELQFSIRQGEIFAFLGPNGGGKTTLFRLLSTLMPLQAGSVRVLGRELPGELQQVRQRLGVVFQAPSLDKKLTVLENLRHQGLLYGLSGGELARRCDEMLGRMQIADRAADLVETLSGGLRRRTELAKSLLHRPQLLLLDEPSTGLDPGVRSSLWEYLRELRETDGVTVVLTTHFLEEADKADRLGILDVGRLVALDTPENLRASVGGDSLTIACDDPHALAGEIHSRFEWETNVVDGQVWLQQPEAHNLIPPLVEAFGERIDSVTLGKPSLEDVFIARTGHRFSIEREEVGVG